MIVGYHFPCTDGLTAAWVARRAGVPEENLLPCEYGKPLPERFLSARNEKIVFLDFRPGLDELHALSERNTVHVVDHHQNAYDQARAYTNALIFTRFLFLSKSPPTEVVDNVYFFDNDKSGARLAWDYFFPGEPVPLMISLVEDNDLWRHKLVLTKPFTAVVQSDDFTYSVLDDMVERVERAPESIAEQGGWYMKQAEACVRKVCARHGWTTLHGCLQQPAPIVNTRLFINETAHYLLQKSPVAVVVQLDVQTGQYVYSLRSTGPDVAAVAREFGGNGHVKAAGFSLDRLVDVHATSDVSYTPRLIGAVQGGR